MFSFWSKFYVNIMFYSRVVAYLVSRDMIGYLPMKNAKKNKNVNETWNIQKSIGSHQYLRTEDFQNKLLMQTLTLRKKCPYFPAFGLNTERYSVSVRIPFKYGKMRTRITLNTDNFHAVLIEASLKCLPTNLSLQKKIQFLKIFKGYTTNFILFF